MIEIYADGADLTEMLRVRNFVSGFTTNPTLMRRAGVLHYESFVRSVVCRVPTYPVSFEVLADEIPEMERQAHKLASLGENIYVKIPITTTTGICTAGLVHRLLESEIKVNVTAVLTYEQIAKLNPYISHSTPAILSIFAGRIADTGRDPKPYVRRALDIVPKNVKVLWSSCREVYNIYEADSIGCHIITVSSDILMKYRGTSSLRSKDLAEFSRETVQMFYTDAQSYTL
jgi:transaldolase